MARLTLDYSAEQVHPPFEPLPDDQGIVNDVEVSRRDGSSAQVQQDDGPLSVLSPPLGVGRYDTSITVEAYSDDQLPQIASWIKTLGTQDVERYPTVHVNLASNPDLIADAAAVDTQDRLVVTDLPSWMPPDDPDLVIEGYTETISQYSLDITYNCSPGNVYQQVGVWGLMSHELHAAINSSTTSIDVANTDVTQPMLATSGIGSGYGVVVGGEEMQVTAVADSLVTYGAVGTVAHGNNASVSPSLPASLAQGNLMVMVAAIRNSGLGHPDTPAGWTRLAVFNAADNVRVMVKIAGASESAPTVTFTGGVAGADTTAQIIRLAGKWHSASNILVGSAARLNTSAQDIIVPGLPKPLCDNAIVIGVGWKQDDWTSVTPRSGFVEIAEEDTTTGDDQGLVWDYVIQTTAAAIAATPFPVTGGSSAISRSAIFALRCDYQSATVTRSVNGITASHSAGDDVTLSRPMRWGLP